MTIRYLLDTCIISEPVKPNPVAPVLEALDRNNGQIALPAIVWHELQYGIGRLQAGQRKNRLQAYLHDVIFPNFPILPYDEPAARRHALFRSTLEKQGRTISFADGQIAAIALANNLVLVTRNTSDFMGIPELSIENWFPE